MHVFVINLMRREDRRQGMMQQLDHLDLDFEFVPAVDGANLGRDDMVQYRLSKSAIALREGGMHQNEIACLLSHMKVYKMILEKNLPYALVLEDDAVLEPALPGILSAIETLPQVWDVIKLNSWPDKKGVPIGPAGEGFEWSYFKNIGGMTGYIVSRSGAERMLDYIKRKGIYVPIDVVLSWYWRFALRAYLLKPFVVRLNTSSVSDIRAKSDWLPCLVKPRTADIRVMYRIRKWGLTILKEVCFGWLGLRQRFGLGIRMPSFNLSGNVTGKRSARYQESL
ncbi:MAG: glycosyltransferase family 25 protein [Gammaproteobacteria bacterium]|nr:glycosyltransferase family 25 protein [Gammaproteobacteria bacterium]